MHLQLLNNSLLYQYILPQLVIWGLKILIKPREENDWRIVMYMLAVRLPEHWFHVVLETGYKTSMLPNEISSWGQIVGQKDLNL